MICSDGLTSEVPDEQIRECLLATPDPQGAAEELVRLALEAGGNDNVTVIVVGVSVSELKSVVDEDTAPRPS
jgi:protein phosphatase